MKRDTVYNFENMKYKKLFKLYKFTSLSDKVFWSVFVYDFTWYYEDGYTEIFHGEYTEEEDAKEELAWQMNGLLYSGQKDTRTF